MSETSLRIAIYTEPENRQSERTVTEFLLKQVDFEVIDITTDPAARIALESLMRSTSVPKSVVIPTVIAECSCGKHREWWSGYNSDRQNRLFAMVRHLDRINRGEPVESNEAEPDQSVVYPTPH